MSDSNDQGKPQGGGYSLGGSGPAEPLPAAWARASNSNAGGPTGGGGGGGGGSGGAGRGDGFSSGSRIGRIGAWGGGGNGNGSSTPRSGGGRFATLRDIAGSSGPSMGPGPGGPGGMGPGGDDDEDEGPEGDENDAGENWYAGGERSGISVENPDRPPRSGNNVVRDILRKAAEAGQAPQPPIAPSGPFSGPAYTLGSDEVDSSYIPDPSAPQGNSSVPPAGDFGLPAHHAHPPAPGDPGEDQEVATRHITFWRDGFSVEDGPLMRYDEPANSQLLDEINTGHAPPQILNVRVGQPVELRVTRRLNEDYVSAPKRPLGAFEGQGHRLGAAVPEVTGAAASSSSLAGALDPSGIPGAYPTSTPPRTGSGEGGNIQTQFEVDQTLPTTSVQVRLADGTRLVARMNLHHTVGDIRNFINASRPGSSSTPYTVQTTFPNRVLEDNAQTIEQAGLKNSVVVQRLV